MIQKKSEDARRPYFVSLVFAALVVGSQCYAQSPNAAPPLEEIVVTAQRRAERLQDTPVSVTAVSGEQLIARGITDFARLGDVAPGLSISQASNYVKPTIRGAATTQILNAGSPTVAFYVDGNYLLKASQALAGFVDVERVEVLRGPQGTLFGRNAFGGLIQVITKEPENQFDAGLNVTLGNYNLNRVEGFINQPLADNVYLRLSGARERRDGYVENNVDRRNSLNDSDMDFFRGKLRWDATGDLSVTLGAEYWNDQANGGGESSHNILGIPVDPSTNLTNGVTGVIQPRIGIDPSDQAPGGRFGAGTTLTLSDPYAYQANSSIERDLEQVGVYGVVNWDLGPVLAKLQVAHVDYDEFWVTDGDMTPLPSTVQGNSTNSRHTTEELQFSSPSGDGSLLSWVAGAYFTQEEHGDVFFQNFVSACCTNNFPDANTPDGSMTFNPLIFLLDTNTAAAYGQVTVALADSFRLIGGLRYTREEKDFTGDTSTSLSVLPTAWKDLWDLQIATSNLIEDSKTFKKTTWKGGFEFLPSRDHLVYGHVSTGFLSGGFNALADPRVPTSFDDQSITAYELGSKNTLLGGSLILNFAAYYNKMEDLVVVDFIDVNGVALSYQSNAGGITSKGVEVETTWKPTQRATLSLQSAYADAQYDDYLAVNSYQAGEDFIQNGVALFQMAGRRVQQSPEVTVGVSGSYEVPLASGTLTPSIRVYYSSTYRTNDAPYRFAVQDAYTKTDLSLDWTSSDDHWTVQAFIRNLEDEAVQINAERFGGNLAARTLAPPRTYGARIGYRY